MVMVMVLPIPDVHQVLRLCQHGISDVSLPQVGLSVADLLLQLSKSGAVQLGERVRKFLYYI